MAHIRLTEPEEATGVLAEEYEGRVSPQGSVPAYARSFRSRLNWPLGSHNIIFIERGRWGPLRERHDDPCAAALAVEVLEGEGAVRACVLAGATGDRALAAGGTKRLHELPIQLARREHDCD